MNYLFFFPDEMRASALGCYGNSISMTPNYNRLASEGTCFEQEYVANPVCVGSRCAMLTGWYPHVNGYRSLLHFIGKNQPNFLKYFKEAGYDVRMYGKNHCLDDDAAKVSLTKNLGIKVQWKKDDTEVKKMNLPFFSGKYHMLLDPMKDDELEQMPDTQMVNAGVDFLDHYKKGSNPFFLFVSLNNPHAPYTIPEKYYHMYNPDDLPPLKKKRSGSEPDYMKAMRKYAGFDRIDEKTFRKCAAVYLGMVRYCDDMLGRLLEALDRNHLAEDTVVVATSDHGDWAGDYGMIEKWPNAFDDDLEIVPLLFRVPGMPEGTRIREPVSELDIFPTLMELGKIKSNHDHFGKSLIKQIFGGKGSPDSAVYSEGGYDVREQQCFEGTEKDYGFLLRKDCIYYPKMMIQQKEQKCVCRSVMMRKDKWKLVKRTSGENELYDMEADPNEERNLYYTENSREIIQKMEQELLVWYMETSDVVPQST